MLLDMGPILRGEIREMAVDFRLKPEPLNGLTLKEDAHVFGTLRDDAGYIRLTLTADLEYDAECARCLDPVHGVLSLQFERTVVTEGTVSAEKLEDDIDEYVVIKDGMLDVDEQIREALILEFPTKILCSPDCPGLCPRCGKPLRDGPCGCPKDDIDPRWAVLRDIHPDS